MGTEAFWVPAAIAAVSAGAQGYNTISANNRAQASAAQGIAQQQALRQQASGQVGNTIRQVAASKPQQLAAKSTGDFLSTLRQNEAASNPPVSGQAAAPGANPRFAKENAANNSMLQTFGSTNAEDLGQMFGAIKQRQNEGLDMSTLGTDLGLIGAQSGNDMFVNNLRTAVAGQTNPYIGMGASVLGAGAKGLASNLTPAPDPNALTQEDYLNGIVSNSQTPTGDWTPRYKVD